MLPGATILVTKQKKTWLPWSTRKIMVDSKKNWLHMIKNWFMATIIIIKIFEVKLKLWSIVSLTQLSI